jgi:hypothetical protein
MSLPSVCVGLVYLFCSLLATVLSPAAQTDTADQISVTPRIRGTFLQLLEAHGNWTETEWNRLFDDLQLLGIQNLILQWSVMDDVAFYKSKAFRSVRNTPLNAVLELADSRHMRVQIGLAHDSDYWSHIDKSPAEVTAYLKNLRVRSLEAAAELTPILKRHPSVQGWYIPEELDDVNWRAEATRSILFDHIRELSQRLRSLRPGWTISISAFCQGQSSPAVFEHFWTKFYQTTQVDIVFFQDGVGVNKLTLSEVPIYLEAIHNAARQNGRSMIVVIELFRQTSGPPLNNAAFAAVPASLERIRNQLRIASRYSSDGIVAFSIPEYLTPFGGDAASKLFSEYRKQTDGELQQNLRRRAPANVK